MYLSVAAIRAGVHVSTYTYINPGTGFFFFCLVPLLADCVN